MSIFLGCLLLLFLLMCSAFFSAAETAITTIPKAQMKLLLEKKRRGHVLLERIHRNPRNTLVTILVGNTLVNIFSSVLATVLMMESLGFLQLQKHLALGSGLVTGFMTFLILTFGEITPKTIALAHKEPIALFAAPVIIFLNWVFNPIIILLINFPEFVMKVLNISMKPYSQYLTERELKVLIEVSEEDGAIEADEKKMIHRVFEFNDTIIKDVMTPRDSVVAINVTSSVDQIMSLLSERPYSRLPVYSNNIGNIIGVLYAKDLLLWLSGQETKKPQFENLGSALRKPLFVLETRKTDSVFRLMKKEKNHFAVVVNSKGGLVGIVTLEDLVEEIVGEIEDEFEDQHFS